MDFKEKEKTKEMEMSPKEKRIKAITHIYYSNPKIQEVILGFAKNREIVPRYFEGFGKRPDTLQYASDILNLVRKGATSFHASEEIWFDPLQISSDMNQREISNLRKSWDLLIDIDSPFLDCSKIAARLITKALEQHGIKNYGIKFSGSRGFHIIISGKAFPKEFNDAKMKDMFPDWARAISEYLMNYIRRDYNNEAGRMLSASEIIKRMPNLSKDDLEKTYCKKCGRAAKKGSITKFACPVCEINIERKDIKLTKKRLRCVNTNCNGILNLIKSKENYYYCEYCKDPENNKMQLNSDKYPDGFEEGGISAEEIAKLDLVLVAPRHLFRMPYSLHEKTSLASTVIDKSEIEDFNPRQAVPLNVKIKEFYPDNKENEGRQLLAAALSWKSSMDEEEETRTYQSKEFDKIDISKISEEYFPKPIKKLLKGLKDGRKRGFFILLTFLNSLGYSAEYINEKIRDWNKKNEPPLKEGYIKSQISWHLKQRKKILPPNYKNPSFYKDIGLLDGKQEEKNPLAEISKKIRKNKRKFQK